MSTAFIVATVIASLLAITSMLLLFCRLRQLPKTVRKLSPPAPRISIVIPARNEQDNLQVLLPSIVSQDHPAHEVIVVDDQSDDQTSEIAKSHACRVLRSKDLPEGWFGKPWACQQGADAAEGEILCFLDADVKLEPSALSRLVACSECAPEAVISVCPWHRIEKGYEELSVFFNLLMVGGIGAFTYKGASAGGIGLFGQAMWIPRNLYQLVGGHESVKETVLENFHLAGDLERRGIERLCFIGKDSLSMRMFPGGFKELTSSWAKGFSSGADLTSSLAMTLSILWLIGLMALSIITLMLPIAGQEVVPWIAASYLIVAFSLFVLFRKVGRFAWWNAIFFPIALFFYQGLFAHAMIRKRRGATTQWKGRDVA